MKSTISALLVFLVTICQGQIGWERLDEGLELGLYDCPQKSVYGDNVITILRIDTNFYRFNILMCAESDSALKMADEWAKVEKQVAVINLGMYDGSYDPMGMVVNYGYEVGLNLRDWNGLFAFNRYDSMIVDAQLIDRKCPGWTWSMEHYHCYVQGIRVVGCDGVNVWKQDDKIWSMTLLGMDGSGNILWIFSRSPYSVHEMGDILLGAPLDLYNLMYLEGGPAAAMYLDIGGRQWSWWGSYESVYYESDDRDRFMHLPNVIGIKKK